MVSNMSWTILTVISLRVSINLLIVNNINFVYSINDEGADTQI